MDRILRGPGATIELRNYDAGGNLANAGAGGTPTAAVVNSAGTAIAGSPLTITNPGTGRYTIAIPSTLAVLDTYTVTWTLPDTTQRITQFEVVGTFLFTQADLRALDAVLTNETTFPDEAVINARENAERRFEEAAEVSFTLRGTRVWLNGTGHEKLMAPHHELRRVVSGTIDGATLDTAGVNVYPHGLLERTAGWTEGQRNVSLLLEHGYATVPEPVRRAGLLYARTVLLRSALEQSDRATAVFTDLGGYRLTLAGRDGPTGLPEVDAVLAQFGRRPAGSLA